MVQASNESEHDREQRIAVMMPSGEIVEDGAPDDFFVAPKMERDEIVSAAIGCGAINTIASATVSVA